MGAGSGIIKAVKVAVVRWTASLRAPGAWWIGCGALLVVGGRRGWARRPSFHRLAMRKSTCCLLSWVPCSFVIGVSLCLRLCVCVLACVCVCVCMYVVPVHVCACFRKRGPHRISTLHISVGASAGPPSSIRHARRHPDTWTQTDVLAHVGNRDRKWRRNCAGALGRQAATLSLCLTHEAFGEVESWLIHRELAMPSMPCSLCACTVRRHTFLETSRSA